MDANLKPRVLEMMLEYQPIVAMYHQVAAKVIVLQEAVCASSLSRDDAVLLRESTTLDQCVFGAIMRHGWSQSMVRMHTHVAQSLEIATIIQLYDAVVHASEPQMVSMVQLHTLNQLLMASLDNASKYTPMLFANSDLSGYEIFNMRVAMHQKIVQMGTQYQQMQMANIPKDVLRCIVDMCAPVDRRALYSTCHYFKEIIDTQGGLCYIVKIDRHLYTPLGRHAQQKDLDKTETFLVANPRYTIVTCGDGRVATHAQVLWLLWWYTRVKPMRMVSVVRFRPLTLMLPIMLEHSDPVEFPSPGIYDMTDVPLMLYRMTHALDTRVYGPALDRARQVYQAVLRMKGENMVVFPTHAGIPMVDVSNDRLVRQSLCADAGV